MATALNLNRKRDTRRGVLLFLAVVLIAEPRFAPLESFLNSIQEIVGGLLIAAAAIGRIYTTAFIGGHKNETLVTYGPFSICRNPLYFFSFIGALGVGIISHYLLFMIALPLLFCRIYFALIAREEVFLREQFGATYDVYCARVPRFFPRLSLYQAPDTVIMKPEFLNKALRDSLLWFLAIPFMELVEYIHTYGLIPYLITLP
jgi:protein-S-isoprenylcysteine O-methyltransferase Ste14